MDLSYKELHNQTTQHNFNEVNFHQLSAQEVNTDPIFTNDNTNSIHFDDLSQIQSLISVIISEIEEQNNTQFFSDDFNFVFFYDQIWEAILSFEEDLIFFNSKLLLTLSYVSNTVFPYLAEHIEELIALFKEVPFNKYITILFHTTLIKFPATVHEAIDYGILGIFLHFLEESSDSIDPIYINIISSTIQFITLNQNIKKKEDVGICITIIRRFLLLDIDEKSYSSLFNSIQHLQTAYDIPPQVFFDDPLSVQIMIQHLSDHKCINSILNAIFGFHDPAFFGFLFESELLNHISSIISSESEAICIDIIHLFAYQLKTTSPELVVPFSSTIPFYLEKFDQSTIHLKISFAEFFIICLETNFDFFCSQEYFEVSFETVFDILESTNYNQLSFFVASLLNLNEKFHVVSQFILEHPICYQAIYDLCMHNEEAISTPAQQIMTTVKELEVE